MIMTSNPRTMYGYDYCSPGRGLSATGRHCRSACHETDQADQHHFKCVVDGRDRMENCGMFAEDLDYSGYGDIEYSHLGKVGGNTIE